MLIDTHAHLTDERFFGAKDIIDNMAQDNLGKIISVGYDIASSEGSMAFADKHENIYFASGIHPNNTDNVTDADYKRLIELALHPKCVAIGEIGLDYHYPETNKPKQHQALIKQLEIVSEVCLPAIFHLRDAYGDFYDVIKQNRACVKKGAVMHCFSGSLETAKQYVDMGFYISFSGSLTFKNARALPEIAEYLPREVVLIETDCPYLAPHPHRGETNYPKYVALVAKKLAQIWNMDENEVIRITTENAQRLFSRLARN